MSDENRDKATAGTTGHERPWEAISWPITAKTTCTKLMADGWEPFAVADGVMWFKRRQEP